MPTLPNAAPASVTDMTFAERAIRAAKLDPAAYEEVEADPNATVQALAIVLLANIAGGIGYSFGHALPMPARIVQELIAWIIWAGLTYAIGVYLIPQPQTRSNFGELLRTIGFSQSAGVLKVLGVLPLVGGLIYLGVSLWMLVTMVVAVRQALDYRSTARAVVVCLIGLVLANIFRVILL
jgi:hypothetical protein